MERSLSLMALLRSLQLRRVFLGHHAVDHPAAPHGACVDVQIVEDAIGILVHRLLLRFENDLVLAENSGHAFADFRGDLLLGDAVVAHERPEIVAGGFGFRRHRVEDVTVDSLRAVAFGRAGPGWRHADIDIHRAWGLEMNDLPAVDRAGLAELSRPERWRFD